MTTPTDNEQWLAHEPAWSPTPDPTTLKRSTPEHVLTGCSCGESTPTDLYGPAWFGSHLADQGAPDYMQTYWASWATHVEAPHGRLDRDAVARELFDYAVVMEQASIAYCELSGLSKPNTAAHHVISFTERKFAERYANLILCDLLPQMDSDDTKQAVIDYAEQLHEGSYKEYLDARASIEKYLAEREVNA